ncbi:hypothetical protein KGA65_06705 [Ideonella sp. B7]|uniref:hypothetical protein n=1 Tax=Ideonella benzenivorans TaxID=2831643 RepID=UPI001CECE78D|nr:hypothetical protein [Ideonella benzenivorans]MCA6216226.1 hypothetical protein [Ideonella benzenivorans]
MALFVESKSWGFHCFPNRQESLRFHGQYLDRHLVSDCGLMAQRGASALALGYLISTEINSR